MNIFRFPSLINFINFCFFPFNKEKFQFPIIFSTHDIPKQIESINSFFLSKHKFFKLENEFFKLVIQLFFAAQHTLLSSFLNESETKWNSAFVGRRFFFWPEISFFFAFVLLRNNLFDGLHLGLQIRLTRFDFRSVSRRQSWHFFGQKILLNVHRYLGPAGAWPVLAFFLTF